MYIWFMRIDEIRIQNYKSFIDVKIELKDINLFIGANNSGKTNFLRALKFLRVICSDFNLARNLLVNDSHNRQEISGRNPFAITIKHIHEDRNYVFRIEIYDTKNEDYAIFCGLSIGEEIDIKFNLPNLNYIDSHFYSYTIHTIGSTYQSLVKSDFKSQELGAFFNTQINQYKKIQLYKHNKDGGYLNSTINTEPRYFLNQSRSFDGFEEDLLELIDSLKVYKPDPNKIMRPYPLNSDETVNEDASNLVSFFDKMKDINTEVMDKINIDLSNCIKEFKDLRFDTIKKHTPEYNELVDIYQRDTFKKIGISDINKNIYWADELSEGALYFIALLAIIHQPNPPKVLLLEEPEKGIHPRRIQETINYLQQLSIEKEIQIILTSHSSIIVDQFAHDTSKIFVFDKENGETKILNLQKDIIIPKNNKLKKKNIDPINYEEALGENWIMGLLNGVPND